MTLNTLPEESFKAYLFHNRRNRTLLWAAAAVMAIQFAVFKYFYPYASFIHGDSLVYLSMAQENFAISTYMTGYAKFIRLFSVITSSDTILVAFQYFLIQSSSLFLLFTLFYFYRPSKITEFILLIFMVFNPLFLHLANLISSDGYFLALSLIWFTTLMWIIYKPNTRIILLHIVVTCIAFTVRYNALLYPFISIIVLLLCKLPARRKIYYIGTILCLCVFFVVYTSHEYKKLTGTWQYSPFNGWLTANNALYAYRHVDSLERKPVPKKFSQLDQMVRNYFDTTRNEKKRTEEKTFEAVVGNAAFMWAPNLMLYQYRERLFKKHTAEEEFKRWATMGPLYKAYGTYLIRQYPIQYIHYFLWPNTINYYSPRIEFLGNYNSGSDEVWPLAKRWFGYKSNKVTTRTKNKQVVILNFYPILSGVVNVVMLCCLMCFAMLKGLGKSTLFRKGVLLATILWVLNAIFTIMATSAALRYQAFPILLTTIFALLLVNWLWEMARD